MQFRVYGLLAANKKFVITIGDFDTGITNGHGGLAILLFRAIPLIYLKDCAQHSHLIHNPVTHSGIFNFILQEELNGPKSAEFFRYNIHGVYATVIDILDINFY